MQSFQLNGNGALIPAGNNQSSAVTAAFIAKASAQQALSNFSSNLVATGVAEDSAGRFLVGTLGDDAGESLMAFKIDANTRTIMSLQGSHRVGATRPTDIVVVSF